MRIDVFGFELSIRKAAANLSPVGGRGAGGWYPIIREPFTGAWQQNAEIRGETALSNSAVYSCVTQISTDIGKMRLRLVQIDDEGIWQETTNPAYSPVLRKPNRYQLTGKFIEQWIASKLYQGNTYVLKERDTRGVVRALYVLDPSKVRPLVAPDGSVYYELRRDDLTGLASMPPADLLTNDQIVVPASEIIHDLMVPLFHPLIGVSPLYACGLAALQGLTIQATSTRFFEQGSHPGGVLTAPGAIADTTASRLKSYWQENFTGPNVGKVAILGDGLHYEPMTVSAADSQLIEQLKWSTETICACFHVPAYMVTGTAPPTSSVEPMLQQYYSQCVQSLATALENSLDDGLDLVANGYGTEFDIDDLVWMDTATRVKAAADGIGSAALTPNEARRKYFGLGPIVGGDTVYMQQQNYSLAALDARDKTNPLAATPAPAAPPPEPDPEPEPDPDDDEGDDEPGEPDELTPKAATWAAVAVALLRKDWRGVTTNL